MDFQSLLKTKTEAIEEQIRALLPQEEGFQKTVISAMNYAVLAGGKRLRPLFMGEAHGLFQGNAPMLPHFQFALECIHTYSLIHDDLPALDNDELRRGKPSTWKQFGHAMGILAGDGLLNYAAETASGAFLLCRDHSELVNCARAEQVLFGKSGIYGMLGGQVLDVEAEGRAVDKEELFFIHANKTAALIEASLMIGGILAGADEESVLRLEEAGRNIGLAFQIQDDLLDMTGTEEELGKPIGSDERNGKNTYVTLFGPEKSKEDAEAMLERAIRLLQGFPARNEFLEELVRHLIGRRH